MTDLDVTRTRLAPLQRLMLRDTWAGADEAAHVEQVEIQFRREIPAGRVLYAWRATVVATEALRISFSHSQGEPVGWEWAKKGGELELLDEWPNSWEIWRERERRRPLLIDGCVPWRACFASVESRFLWTFHHALLDGRSIAGILRAFLIRLAGGEAEILKLSVWKDPLPDEVEKAAGIFRRAGKILPSEDFSVKPELMETGPAMRCLGLDFAERLETLAVRLDVTAATLLTWSWAQAVAAAAGVSAVMVEQVRCGRSQPGTAGFSMVTLPLVIARSGEGKEEECLRDFRKELLALREIESVSEGDFPPGEFPDVNAFGASVVMVERGTLRQMVGSDVCDGWIESLVLLERQGEWLTASAHIRPGMRLQVEGAGRHRLLDHWIDRLVRFLPLTREAGAGKMIAECGVEEA